MKTKTIKAVLEKKFDDFTKSIDDPIVKGLVKSNSIITGGSIVSMLLKEPINDYDIYFTNWETANAVANYYAKKFNETQNTAEVKIISERDKRVHIRIQSKGIASETQENNYQYFETLPDPDSNKPIEFEEDTVQILEEAEDPNKPKYRPIFFSTNAITLSNKVQIITRFYGNAEEIHKNFDFAHLKNWWLSKDNTLYLSPKALELMLTKELVYDGSLYPLASVIRTKKFLKKGWTINAGQYLKMLYQVAELDLNNVEVLEDQLVGVDAAYFQLIIGGLRTQMETTGFKLSFEYIATIIDKVF